MKVVLFCGGLGMRMREGAASAPKPMAMIGDRPLLWHVMRYYAHFGHTDFILCLGYGAAAVKEYFLHYDETLSNDFTLAGGGRDVRLLSTDITDWNITFIDTGLSATIGERLMRVRDLRRGRGDVPGQLRRHAHRRPAARAGRAFRRSRRGGAACSPCRRCPPTTSWRSPPTGRSPASGRSATLMQWENGGYFVMRPEHLRRPARRARTWSRDACHRLVADGRLLAQRYNGFWRAADTFKDRAELEDMYVRGQCPWMLWDPGRAGLAHPQAHRRAGEPLAVG